MTINLLYRALYVLVHFVFTVCEQLFGTLRAIGALFVDFCHEFGDIQKVNLLKTELAKSGKLPKHLTVLLGSEQPSYQDLSNIVVWCMVNRIGFLSFYDYKGTLKKHQDKLQDAVSKKLSSSDHVTWHNHPGSTLKNGYSGRKIHIKILCQDDGKSRIVKLVQELCKNPPTVNCTIALIDGALREHFEFPEPDLGLNCGPFLYLLGYPPWQIRVTEFLSIKSYYRISYRTFLEQLYIYGKCEQRLGT